jgi:hypothetical protein
MPLQCRQATCPADNFLQRSVHTLSPIKSLMREGWLEWPGNKLINYILIILNANTNNYNLLLYFCLSSLLTNTPLSGYGSMVNPFNGLSSLAL